MIPIKFLLVPGTPFVCKSVLFPTPDLATVQLKEDPDAEFGQNIQ